MEHFSFNTITIEVINLCVLFISASIEFFAIIGSGINVSTDRLTIKKCANSYNWLNTSYGKNIIPSTCNKIITWTIKMAPYEKTQHRCIGIASTTDCTDKDFSTNPWGFFYSISGSATKFTCKYKSDTETADKYGKAATLRYLNRSGNDISITLNLQSRTLEFGHGKHTVIAWSNIMVDKSISYRFAASLRSKSDWLMITDYIVSTPKDETPQPMPAMNHIIANELASIDTPPGSDGSHSHSGECRDIPAKSEAVYIAEKEHAQQANTKVIKIETIPSGSGRIRKRDVVKSVAKCALNSFMGMATDAYKTYVDPLMDKQDIEEENTNEVKLEADESAMCVEVLKSWNLGQYSQILIDEKGYDHLSDWEDIDNEELCGMGFKEGHARRFISKSKKYFQQK